MAKRCVTYKEPRADDPVTFDRIPGIIAAGIPSKREDIKESLQHYLLKDEVDSLIGDVVEPPVKPRKLLPPLRQPKPRDTRFAFFTDVAQVANPPVKSKFQTLVDDVKETSYASYWKKPLGRSKDPAPMLPAGMDSGSTTFGKYDPRSEDIKNVIYPNPSLPDNPKIREGLQKDYKYCTPPFNRDLVYGHKYDNDLRASRNMKAALTDTAVKEGRGMTVLMTAMNTDYRKTTQTRLGKSLAPIENIKYVPEGHTFGIPTRKCLDCFAGVYIRDPDPKKEFYMECLAFINSFRKIMRMHLSGFFRNLYQEFKYFDKDHSGWLPKEVVYNHLKGKLIRLDPRLVEPLFKLWNIDDGKCFDYKKVVDIINHTVPLPNLPKIVDFPLDCLCFETTYSEMTKPCKKSDPRFQAGTPSGRYFDSDYPTTPEMYCKADQICLPDESDVKSCLCPSIMSRNLVTHRDMFAKREPEVVQKVFEAVGYTFTDEEFKELWKKAQIYHSQGWVCFETFRKVLENRKEK